MSFLSSASAPQRVIFAGMGAIILLLSGILSFGVLGSSNSAVVETVHACQSSRDGSLYNVSFDKQPNCRLGDSTVSWLSVDPGSLDDVFVNEGQPNAISSGMIQDGAVGEDELADDSVSTSALQDGSVTGETIDESEVQRRIDDECDDGESIASINSDGEVTCVSGDAEAGSVRIESELFELDEEQTAPFSVSCGAGSFAIGGGAAPDDIAESQQMITNNSAPSGADQTWRTTVTNADDESRLLVEFFAVCFDPPENDDE